MCLNLPILQICRVYKRQPIVAMPTPTAVYDTDASMLMFFCVRNFVSSKAAVECSEQNATQKISKADYMCTRARRLDFAKFCCCLTSLPVMIRVA